MPIRVAMLSTAAVALLTAAAALAQQPAQNMSPQERSFVRDAAIGGKAEVQLGQLAEQNAQSEQVKQFGQKMVQDHSRANQQLEQIASQKGIQLPQQPDAEHMKEYDRLSKMRGAEFDRAYMQHMVRDHDKDVKEFEKEAQNGKDPEIRNFAQQTLPTLQQHDQMAHNVNGALTGAGSSRQSR